MNKQNLIIYKFKSLYKIFKELEENLNFKIFDLSEEKNLKGKLNNYEDYLIITKKKIENSNNQLVLNEFPIKISNFIEKLNIQILKNQFNKKSEIMIGKYMIDLNSRELKLKDTFLKLTEKEINTIVYLHKSSSAVGVHKLQSKVWSYEPNLETHTVETHIYRLRKKILQTFNDNNFIISKKNGYQII
jgi:hypothetical protein